MSYYFPVLAFPLFMFLESFNIQEKIQSTSPLRQMAQIALLGKRYKQIRQLYLDEIKAIG